MKKLTATLTTLTMMFGLCSMVTFSQSPSRTVLIEEFTGEWCGWCPIGMMELENMIEKYADTLIVVAVHTGDPLESPSASAMIGAWGNSAPSALLNREYDSVFEEQVFGPENWEEVIARQIQNPAPCYVYLDYSYNEASREIVATVTAAFNDDYYGDGRLNLYIVEDSVIGVSQSNYLSGNPDFINTPFYSLPEYIPNFAHQHVLREMLGESYGIDGIIPDTVYAGQQFQYTFNYIVPEEYNLQKLHIIGVVQQYKGLKKYRKILNAAHYLFDHTARIKGISHIPDLIVSPVPATNSIRLKIQDMELIKKVQVFSVSGIMVFSGEFNGHDIHISTEKLPDGYYTIFVETNNRNGYGKILISR